MQIGLNEIRELIRLDRKKARRKLLAVGLVLLILFAAFVCTRSTELSFVNPLQAAANLFTALRINIARLFSMALYENRRELIDASPYYLETLGRLTGGLVAIILGASLAVAGAVFQCAFRNPLATPAMLGTSTGVRIVNMILVLQYSYEALAMVKTRFLASYIGGLLILLILMAGARIMSKKKSSVADILLLGAVFSRIAGQVINYIQFYVMDESGYETLQNMNMYGVGMGEGNGVGLVLIFFLIGMIPLFLIRTSMNTLSFGDEEARCLGIKAPLLRLVALLCSVILSTTTLVYVGEVGMLSMLIPVICRYIYGSDFKYLLIGSALSGALLMLICKIIVSVFAFHPYLSLISTGLIIEVISAPIMIFVIFKNRRGWE